MKLFFIILMFFGGIRLSAQEIKVKSMDALVNDLSARTKPRQDSNGVDCALVKVLIPAVKGLSFSGWVVGDVNYIPGEYDVYVPEGTKKIKFHHENFVPGEIVFSMPIESKCVYKVILEACDVETKYESNSNTKIAVSDDQVADLKSLSDAYKEKNDYDNAIATYKEFLAATKEPTVNDYVALANLYRNATSVKDQEGQIRCIKEAVAVYNYMINKFPASYDYSNFMAARTIQVLDPDQNQGLAVPYYKALFDAITTTGIKEDYDKMRLSEACTYLGIYYFKIKNDKISAKPYFVKLQEVDPYNTLAEQVLEILK